jgi:hypothetical protein
MRILFALQYSVPKPEITELCIVRKNAHIHSSDCKGGLWPSLAFRILKVLSTEFSFSCSQSTLRARDHADLLIRRVRTVWELRE